MDKYGQDIKISFQTLTPENSHYTEAFSCGNETIDRYFREDAFSENTSVTYMYVDAEADKLIACVTIACSAIFSKSEEEFQFSTILSAMEVKYLATDVQYQHMPFFKNGRTESLSDMMFDHFITYMAEMSHTQIGAAKIVLYSVPEAVSFYTKHGFKAFGDTMYGDKGYFVEGCSPMFYDLNE